MPTRRAPTPSPSSTSTALLADRCVSVGIYTCAVVIHGVLRCVVSYQAVQVHASRTVPLCVWHGFSLVCSCPVGGSVMGPGWQLRVWPSAQTRTLFIPQCGIEVIVRVNGDPRNHVCCWVAGQLYPSQCSALSVAFRFVDVHTPLAQVHRATYCIASLLPAQHAGAVKAHSPRVCVDLQDS